MKIKFINHACVMIDDGKTKILCDPWLSGSIFNNGWDLIHQNNLRIEDLECDYIWLSHEHPDHFSPLEFSNTTQAFRKKVKIILQKRKDRKLLNFLKDKNYNVIEIEDKLSCGEIEVCGGVTHDFDSWIAFKSKDILILNLNDCQLSKNDIRELKNKLGKIDVLLTQFSFANWSGNSLDDLAYNQAKEITFNSLQYQVNILDPHTIIPFASFVYFSHEENFNQNYHTISLEEFLEYFKGRDVAVMKPFDVYNGEKNWDNNKKVSFWNDEFKKAKSRSLHKTLSFDLEALNNQFKKMTSQIKRLNKLEMLLDPQTRAKFFPPTLIYLKDIDTIVSFDILEEALLPLNKSKIKQLEIDIEISSESLYNLMKYKWARGTLFVNGRFTANYSTFWRFMRQTQIYYANNIELYFPESYSLKSLLSFKSSYVGKLIGSRAASEK